MDSRVIVSSFLIALGLCMLTQGAHGSFPYFFSLNDVCEMQKGGPCKKSLQQRSDEGNLRSVGGLKEVDILKLKAPVEIEVKFDSQQMENYRNTVEDIFTDESKQS